MHPGLIAIIIVAGAFTVLAICAVADTCKNHESCTPTKEQEDIDGILVPFGSHSWGWVDRKQFRAIGRCSCCNRTSRLYSGRCAICWEHTAQSLCVCEDCCRIFEPAPSDSADLCPRCIVLQSPIIAIPAEAIEPQDKRPRHDDRPTPMKTKPQTDQSSRGL